ncbi:MAG: hypothetical protein KDJ86_03515 [Bauldia sp.]|uniref:hypothetical protein n=1 Tax=Bauldia sp. TaxID=2575872 RepID=UPI001DCEE2D8|nr:hypothetical protein [Bauldia sp.]MCB1494831.1 hypothetical protein [Bauldia sp.]
MSHLRYSVLAMAVLLAACDNAPPAQDTKSEAPAPAKEETAAPAKQDAAPAKQDAAAPKPAAAADDTETVTNNACLAAVKKETGEGKVSILSNEFSEANTLVMLGVGDNDAPWKCLVSNDGAVQEIEFTGNDGDGVPAEGADADDGGGAMDGAAAGGSDVSQAAIDACLAAVKKETSEPDLAVTSSEFSEANSMVMIGVGAQRAPWKCLVSNDGTVQEISFTGSEGAE